MICYDKVKEEKRYLISHKCEKNFNIEVCYKTSAIKNQKNKFSIKKIEQNLNIIMS